MASKLASFKESIGVRNSSDRKRLTRWAGFCQNWGRAVVLEGGFSRATAWVSISVKQSPGPTSLSFVLECFSRLPQLMLVSCAFLVPGYITFTGHVSGLPLVCECHSLGTFLPNGWENLDSSHSFATGSPGLSGKPPPLPWPLTPPV